MGLFDALDISATGLTAERLRMDVTAENLANAQTTRGADGQPYRRKEVVLAEVQRGGFGAQLAQAIGAGCGAGAQPGRRRGRGDRRGPDARQARLRPRPPRRRRARATCGCRTSTRSPRWST